MSVRYHAEKKISIVFDSGTQFLTTVCISDNRRNDNRKKKKFICISTHVGSTIKEVCTNKGALKIFYMYLLVVGRFHISHSTQQLRSLNFGDWTSV